MKILNIPVSCFFNHTEHNGNKGIFVLPHADDSSFYFLTGIHETVFMAVAGQFQQVLNSNSNKQIESAITELLELGLLSHDSNAYPAQKSLTEKEILQKLKTQKTGQALALNFMNDLQDPSMDFEVYAQACCASSGASRGA